MPKRLENIKRYDSKGVHGWLVRFKRRRRPFWNWFMDSAYGGRERSVSAAIDWRDFMLRKLPPALNVSSRDVRNTTGVVGVHLDWSRDKSGRIYYNYRASWPDGHGGTVKRNFSVNYHGKQRALELATRRGEKVSNNWRRPSRGRRLRRGPHTAAAPACSRRAQHAPAAAGPEGRTPSQVQLATPTHPSPC